MISSAIPEDGSRRTNEATSPFSCPTTNHPSSTIASPEVDLGQSEASAKVLASTQIA